MSIENKQQMHNTRIKLRELEELGWRIRLEPASGERVRELTV